MSKRRPRYSHTTATVTLQGEKYVFDSVLEAEVFLRLEHLRQLGIYAEIERQVRLELLPPSGPYKKPMIYTADFVVTLPDKTTQIIEAKSRATHTARDWPIRKRLLWHATHRTIIEVSDPEKFLNDTLAAQKK